jgi:alcohol dehydrogenase class IV
MYHVVPHGMASAALLPAVLDFLRDYSAAKDKMKRLDELFAPYGDVRTFIDDLGVSTWLSSYGVLPGELENFVQKVIVKSDIRVTPAPVTGQDIFRIYQSAL